MNERVYRDLSKNEQAAVVKALGLHHIFDETMPMADILKNSKIVEYEPYETIWDGNSVVKPLFSLILKGSVAVMYDGGARSTMNALLVPGQLFGEFELMKPGFRSNKLKALSKVHVLIPDHEDISRIQAASPGAFYKNLSNELIHKLYRQNHFINFRSRNRINERIAYFLHRLQHEDFNGVATKVGRKNNAYTIDMLFSMSMFESFIDSSHKTICGNLIKLLKQGVIKIIAYDENFEQIAEWAVKDLEGMADQSRIEISETMYFKFEVTDYQNLTAWNGLKKLI